MKKDTTEGQESRLIHALLPLAKTVSWLNQVQSVAVQLIPAEHREPLKQLESLGLIYRRNRTTCALQRQRLIRMLKRESQFAPAELQSKFINAYLFLFRTETDL